MEQDVGAVPQCGCWWGSLAGMWVLWLVLVGVVAVQGGGSEQSCPSGGPAVTGPSSDCLWAWARGWARTVFARLSLTRVFLSPVAA